MLNVPLIATQKPPPVRREAVPALPATGSGCEVFEDRRMEAKAVTCPDTFPHP